MWGTRRAANCHFTFQEMKWSMTLGVVGRNLVKQMLFLWILGGGGWTTYLHSQIRGWWYNYFSTTAWRRKARSSLQSEARKENEDMSWRLPTCVPVGKGMLIDDDDDDGSASWSFK